jgi:hypothetical protein
MQAWKVRQEAKLDMDVKVNDSHGAKHMLHLDR